MSDARTRTPRLPEPIDAMRRPVKVYSPGQIAGAAFLGAPIAGCVLLASNFAFFGMPEQRRNAIVWGCIGTVAVFAIALMLPDGFPDSVLPMVYCVALQRIAVQTQGSLFDPYMSHGGRKHSNWRVFGIGLLWGLGLFLVLLAVLFALPDEVVSGFAGAPSAAAVGAGE